MGSHGDEEAEERDGAHEMHEYEVFHVEFDRVEIPFIIALWIFVSSLAKIGSVLFLVPTKIFICVVFILAFSIKIGFLVWLEVLIFSVPFLGFHMTPKVAHIFPESCLLIVVGILIGFLLFLTTDHPPSTLTPGK